MVLRQPYCSRIIGSIFAMGEEFLVEFDDILSPHDPAPMSLTQQQLENLQYSEVNDTNAKQ